MVVVRHRVTNCVIFCRILKINVQNLYHQYLSQTLLHTQSWCSVDLCVMDLGNAYVQLAHFRYTVLSSIGIELS